MFERRRFPPRIAALVVVAAIGAGAMFLAPATEAIKGPVVHEQALLERAGGSGTGPGK
jgi:hypothetical protein